jgi:hypothetical protein
MRSLKPGVDHAEQVAHCLEGDRIAIGWGIESLPSGSCLADVLVAIEKAEEPGWGRQAASTVRLFGEEAKDGDYVWTRDLNGRFRLARITGSYYYDNSRLAKATDTHQVRPASWAQEPLGDLEVPGAVIRAFSGPSTSFSRIWDRGARIYTAWIWEKLNGREPSPPSFSSEEALLQLDPYDLEDLIYTWMQVCGGYLALPRARRTDTPAYEWTMLHREHQTPAIVQVKSGLQGVDLDALAAAAPTTTPTSSPFRRQESIPAIPAAASTGYRQPNSWRSRLRIYVSCHSGFAPGSNLRTPTQPARARKKGAVEPRESGIGDRFRARPRSSVPVYLKSSSLLCIPTSVSLTTSRSAIGTPA